MSERTDEAVARVKGLLTVTRVARVGEGVVVDAMDLATLVNELERTTRELEAAKTEIESMRYHKANGYGGRA